MMQKPLLGSARRQLPAIAVLLFLAGMTLQHPVQAAEISTWLGANAATSGWHGDGGGGFAVALAGRWRGWLGAEVQVWEQLWAVDHRVNTGITAGITGSLPGPHWQPGARLFVIHQHEEGLVSVQASPWGTVFGIGSGIRHRAGAGLDLRAETGVAETPLGRVGARVGLTGVLFPDTALGPAWYLGLAADVGLVWSVVAR